MPDLQPVPGATTPRTLTDVYEPVRNGLETLCDDLYGRLDRGISHSERGLDCVLALVTDLRARAAPDRKPHGYGDILNALKDARAFLEDDKAFDALRSRQPWDDLWNSAPHYGGGFRLMVEPDARDDPKQTRVVSRAGYVMSRTADGWRPNDPDAQIECLMEFLSAVWCGLLLFGIRADSLWNKMLHLAAEETGGLPSGVCVYKAYGDIYRHALRELETLHRFDGQLDEHGTAIDIGDREMLGVKQLLMNPCLFGSVDIDKPAQHDSPLDLSPASFRRVGALYYLLYQIAYLRSGNPFTLIWLYNEGEVEEGFGEKAKRWLRNAYRCPERTDGGYDPAKRRRYAFWACPSSEFAQPPCVLGLRHGVINVDINPTSKAAAAARAAAGLSGVTSVPFGARRVANALFASLTLVIQSMATQIESQLPAPGSGGSSRVFDLLEMACREDGAAASGDRRS